MSVTLDSDALCMYTHHSTELTEPDRLSEYHITHVTDWLLNSFTEQCRQSLSAFCNERNFVKKQRDNFIKAVNAKVKTKPSIPLNLTVSEIEDLPYDAQTQGSIVFDDDLKLNIPLNELNSIKADKHMYCSEEISQRQFKGFRH